MHFSRPPAELTDRLIERFSQSMSNGAMVCRTGWCCMHRTKRSQIKTTNNARQTRILRFDVSFGRFHTPLQRRSRFGSCAAARPDCTTTPLHVWRKWPQIRSKYVHPHFRGEAEERRARGDDCDWPTSTRLLISMRQRNSLF